MESPILRFPSDSGNVLQSCSQFDLLKESLATYVQGPFTRLLGKNLFKISIMKVPPDSLKESSMYWLEKIPPNLVKKSPLESLDVFLRGVPALGYKYLK